MSEALYTHEISLPCQGGFQSGLSWYVLTGSVWMWRVGDIYIFFFLDSWGHITNLRLN